MSVDFSSTLPRPFTALVGRVRDIAEVSRMLDEPTGSVLTLVGPAGVGKTRLAIAVANAVADRFDDGVVYVDLAAVIDSQQVLPMLAGAIGIPDGEGVTGRLSRALADRSLLLVVDNFEQVRDAAPLLNSCLAGAVNVRTLVTSQAPLRVRGEREYSVDPLPMPNRIGSDADAADYLRAIEASPAVELFVRRAQMVRPAFALTTANAAAVFEICQRLDGLPLAIELAAARSNVLSPEALLSRLSAPLQLLSGGPRDVPDRHRALESALAWSHDLLTSNEAVLLERLSVFSGTFSLAAAEAVAGCEPIAFEPSFYAEPYDLPPNEPALESGRIFDLLDALADHSLVQRVDHDENEPRFRLFTTIRQFALEKLRARGGEAQIALRHATWFRSRAEATWTPAGPSVPESEWLEPPERDFDNYRAAIAWLTETDPATANTFVAAIGWHFYFLGRRNEGIRAFERTDGRFDPAMLSPVNRARGHYIRGVLLAHCPGREPEGAAHLEAMLAEVEALEIDWAVGFALLALGVTADDAGEAERALDLFYRARPILDRVGGITAANVDFHIASALVGLGRISEAHALVEPILALDPGVAGVNRVYALHLLGVMSIIEGNLPKAAATTRQFIDTAFQYHIGKISTEATNATATIAVRSGDMELGARLFGTADRVNLDADYAIQFPELPIYLAARDTASDSLGQDRFDELYRAGSQIGFDAAMEQVREVLDAIAAGRPPSPDGQESMAGKRSLLLTPREREVLQLVSFGLTDREIGERLFISHRTARTHVGNILGKLDVPSRSAATSLALREGLVHLEDVRR